MKYLCSGKQMQEVDRYSIETVGIPSLVLMERAALAVRDAAAEKLPPGGLAVAVCGSGNNGADGMAAVRMLALEGFRAEVVLAGSREHMTKECRIQMQILEKLGVPVHGLGEAAYDSISRADVLLDALFGVGLSRKVEGKYAEAVKAMNASSAFTVAVDIPSGVCAESGQILGEGVRAHRTVTFGYEKLGQAMYPGSEFCGELYVAEIGFAPAPEDWKARFAYTYTKEDLAGLPERQSHSNKGSFGKAAVVAGSRNMAGAAFLCGLGAYRAGAGLVRLVTEEENREILQTLLPEAVMTVLDGEWEKALLEALDWATVIVLGPGLGQSEKAVQKAETVLRYKKAHPEKPVLIDADGLNLLARHPEWKDCLQMPLVLTPHPAELSRLLGWEMERVLKELPQAARKCAEEFHCVAVAKDARTVVTEAEGPFFLNTSGTSAMAKAGSGDVLSGAVAGLIACGLTARKAAEYGVYLHGLAGERWEERYGRRGLTAGELADCLGELGV